MPTLGRRAFLAGMAAVFGAPHAAAGRGDTRPTRVGFQTETLTFPPSAVTTQEKIDWLSTQVDEIAHAVDAEADRALPLQRDDVYLDVLARAPVRLIRAGLGDSLCRPTAQADWLLAHLLHGQPYREAPFALLAEDEGALLADPEALVAGDREAIARLARTLVLSGFGMSICGGSYPASQGEHLVSHYADMRPPPGAPASLHGEQIGVTTLTMARLQERVLAGGPPRLQPTRVDEAALVRHFGPALGRACWTELAPKRHDARPTGMPAASISRPRRAGSCTPVRSSICACCT